MITSLVLAPNASEGTLTNILQMNNMNPLRAANMTELDKEKQMNNQMNNFRYLISSKQENHW